MSFRAKIGGVWYGIGDVTRFETKLARQDVGDRELPTMHGVHSCACPTCDPDLRMATESRNPGHFFVDRDYKVQPFIGDTELALCYEVQTGEDGYALCYSTPTHPCRRCSKGTCAHRIEGRHFSVRADYAGKQS